MGGSRFYRLFFIIYLLFAVLFVYSIMIAVIIDNIVSKKDKIKAKDEFELESKNSFALTEALLPDDYEQFENKYLS